MIIRHYALKRDFRCSHIDHFTVPINDRYQKKCQNLADYRIFDPDTKDRFYLCVTHAQIYTIKGGYDIEIHHLVTPEEKQAILDKWAREARLKELHTMPYRAYLQTPEWKERRKRILERDEYRCSVCNSSKRLNVHHRDYARRGYEDDRDLIVLCRDCHQIFHENGSLARAEA